MTHADDATLAVVLAGRRYPCCRTDLIEHAAARGAGDEVLGVLGGLPDGDFHTEDEVYGAVRASRAGKP